MPVDVLMPQMGESIAEGTVSRWLKKVGDKVDRDEPLLEISTDKVDAEIPSPAAGTLVEILAQEGATVPVNSVVARLAAEGEAAGTSAAPAAEAAPEAVQQQAADQATAQEVKQEAPGVSDTTPVAPAAPAEPVPAQAASSEDDAASSLDERRRSVSSPLVRKIAKENDIDISRIEGTGVSGRVTKNDILDYMQKPQAAQPAAQAPAAQQAPAQRASQAPAPPRQPAPQFAPGENSRLEPLSVMRKKIAQHMVQSKATSAHVSTVFEADFTAIDKLRRKHKAAYSESGVKLTYLPFIVHAVVMGLKEFPILNASMDENNVVYHREFNVGIAVALDWGLIVPVLKQADELNVLGMSRAINDLGERARTKKLMPNDVQGGTFTITNPGIYGGLFGLPIINQPQVAILGVGGVQKRPVVATDEDGNDSIAIRTMCYLSLTFDHRLIDGAIADQFMARVKQIIEGGQYSM